MARKVALRATIRLDAYAVISRAVEEGVATGWRRAHKHVDKPEEGAVRDAIEQAVMNALSEVLRWDEG